MPSRVLLISTNRYTTPDPVFPLGLAHLNAALRVAGYDVRWFDCQASEQPLEALLAEYQPQFIGISLRNIDDVLIRRQETFFEEPGGICRLVRSACRSPIILGGSGFSLFPERLLELTGADYGLRGEGESGLLSLIASLERGAADRTIPGLVYRGTNGVVVNPPRPARVDGSLTPADRPPAFAAHYLRQSGMLNIQTQRGCAHGCCYCTYPLLEGRAPRGRSAEAVADELEALQATGANYVFIVDSIFNSSPGHVVRTCEAILRRKLKLRWGCFLRPQGLTAELMGLMAQAGLSHIEFGSDSFCDSVLEAYGKELSFADILKSSQLANEAGLDYCHFLISGGPGETLATLQAGFENARLLPHAVIMAVIGMRIYPGTSLHRRALAEGRISPDADLLTPCYYLAKDLTADTVFERLREFARESPNWIVGDPDPSYARVVERLRRRGISGPLWSYFALMQRVLPQTMTRNP